MALPLPLFSSYRDGFSFFSLISEEASETAAAVQSSARTRLPAPSTRTPARVLAPEARRDGVGGLPGLSCGAESRGPVGGQHCQHPPGRAAGAPFIQPSDEMLNRRESVQTPKFPSRHPAFSFPRRKLLTRGPRQEEEKLRRKADDLKYSIFSVRNNHSRHQGP